MQMEMMRQMPEAPYLNISASGSIRLKLHVRPGAKRNGVSGVFGEALKVELQTPPVDGKANSALIKLLAKWLDIPKSSITLIAGESCRDKVIELKDINIENIITGLDKNRL